MKMLLTTLLVLFFTISAPTATFAMGENAKPECTETVQRNREHGEKVAVKRDTSADQENEKGRTSGK